MASTTRKNATKKCYNNFCEKSYKTRSLNFSSKMLDYMEKSLLEDEKRLAKFKGTPEEKKNKELAIITKKKAIKRMNSTKHKNRAMSIDMNNCKKFYCNENCKGTIFEKGTTFPAILMKKWKSKKITEKDRKIIEGIFIEDRKELFGDKTDILDNNFYNELDPKKVKTLKLRGAISGCTKNIDWV